MDDYTDLLSNEKYDVSDYLIKNPSIVVGLLSALSALIVILIYSVAYLQDASLLKFWNVPIEFLDLSGKTKVYKTGLTIATSLLLPIINNYVSHYFSVVNKSMKPLAIYNTVLSDEHISSFSRERISVTEIRKNELLKDLKQSLLYLLIPFSFLILLYLTLNIYHLTLRAALLIVLSIATIWLISSSLVMVNNYHKYKKHYKSTISYDDVLECPFPYSFGFIKKNIISNQSILVYFLLLILFIVAFFSVIVVGGTYTSKHPQQFEIVENKSDMKVIVYKASNYVILEPCHVEEDTIIIDVSTQEIVPYSKLNYHIDNYANFERINVPPVS